MSDSSGPHGPAGESPPSPADERLERQLRFLVEVDKLKNVLRRTLLTNGSRRENSAEHSWHIALMAVLLAEHADARLDLARVVRMLLIHDVVEIDAGDTFAYDAAGNADRAERERRAAERLFGILPPDQASELAALWQEFEERLTPEARYAHAVDRLQPLLQNVMSEGGAWRSHNVEMEQVLDRMRPIDGASHTLWRYAEWAVTAVWSTGVMRDPTSLPGPSDSGPTGNA